MMLLGTNDNSINIAIEGFIISQSDSVKLLGVTLDKNLSFQEHIANICAKARKGIWCLRRVRNFINFKQAVCLYNCYVQSYLSYCPLIWMFCNKTSYDMIDNVQKRALRALYNEYDASLDELLERDGTDRIHTIHIRFLLTEIFKTVNGLNPCFLNEVFVAKTVPYCLRNPDLLSLPKANTVRYGINSLRFRGSLLWNNLPIEYKELKSPAVFKEKLKYLNCFNCTCKLCVHLR